MDKVRVKSNDNELYNYKYLVIVVRAYTYIKYFVMGAIVKLFYKKR